MIKILMVIFSGISVLRYKSYEFDVYFVSILITHIEQYFSHPFIFFLHFSILIFCITCFQTHLFQLFCLLSYTAHCYDSLSLGGIFKKLLDVNGSLIIWMMRYLYYCHLSTRVHIQ